MGRGPGGPSLDQIVARKFNSDTRFRSLQVGVSQESFGGSMQKNMSWAGPDRALPPEEIPHRLFDRVFGGKDDGWDPGAPADTLLRPPPTYTLVAGAGERRVGNVYAFDRPNARIIALDKKDGTYRAQYRLAGGAHDWSDLRAMYIIPGIEEAPPTLVWLSLNAVHSAVLEAVPDVAPKASPSAAPSDAAGASGAPASTAP